MPEARPLQPGDPAKVGDYEISGRLGDGGLGIVFQGLSPAGGSVAVKVMRLHSLGDEATRSRFLNELQVARRITTSCTAQVIDTGVIGGSPYIVSEYVRGPSLQELVTAEGPRGRRALERLAIGTATALAALHRTGIVHRDVRPANVLLASDGPRLIDVGVSRALEAAGVSAVLTSGHAYLAPEQSPVRPGGGNIGPASDVFAWGSTVLFAATGKPPFGHGTGPEVMGRIMHDEPGSLQALPESLRDIVADALAKEVTQRPTARELLDRLLGKESPTSGMSERKIAEARTLAADDGAVRGGPSGSGQGGPTISPIPASNATFVSRPDADAAPTAGIAPLAGGAGAPIAASFAPAPPSGQVPPQARPFSQHSPGPDDTARLNPVTEADPTGRTMPVSPYDPGPSYGAGSGYGSGPSYDAGPSYSAGPSYDAGPSLYDAGPSYGAGPSYDQGSSYDRPSYDPARPAEGGGHGDTGWTVSLDSLMDSGAPAGSGSRHESGSGGAGGAGGGFNATTVQPIPAAWPDDAASGRSATRGAPARFRGLPSRPSNRILGVAGAIGIGLVAGLMLVVLVIRPQTDDRGDDKPGPSSSAGALDNTPVQNIPAAFKGTWRGTAVNQDGKSFQVTAIFREGQTSATVLYTPMNCAGVLTFNRGTRSRLDMALTIKARPCTSGNVTVTKQVDGTLIYAWRRPGARHHYRATLKAG